MTIFICVLINVVADGGQQYPEFLNYFPYFPRILYYFLVTVKVNIYFGVSARFWLIGYIEFTFRKL